MPLSFDDLIPQDNTAAPQQQGAPSSGGLSFDDLIPENAKPSAASFDERFGFKMPAQNSIAGSAKAIGAGLGQGAVALAGMPADIGGLLNKGIDYFTGENTPESPLSSRNIQRHVEELTGPFYQPQTRLEEGLNTAGQFAPAMFGGGPEGLASRLITRVAAPAAASEEAGEATRGTAAEPFARFGASLLGGGAAGAAMGVRKLAAPTEAALTAAKNSQYADPIIQNVRLSPSSMNDFADNVNKALLQNKVDKFVAPTVSGIIDRLRTPRFDTNGTVADYDLARQSLSAVPDTEGRAAGIVRGEIDKYLGYIPAADIVYGNPDEANKILLAARGNTAALKRSEEVGNALQRAENQNLSANSYHNLNNATRSQLRPILNEKMGVSKVPGFEDYTPKEVGALRNVLNSKAGNFVADIGKQLGSGGGLGNLAAGITGFGAAKEAGNDWLTSALMGGGAMLGGRVLGGLANRMTQSRTNAVTDLLRKRSPLYQQQAAQYSPGILGNISPALISQALAISQANK